MVDQADIDLSEEAFSATFTGEREGLTLQVQKRDDPTDQIFVFWPSDPKVGVKPIKRCALPADGHAPRAFLGVTSSSLRVTSSSRATSRSGHGPNSAAAPTLCSWVCSSRVRVRYMDRMNELEVKRAILVVQQNLTAFAKQAIVEICASEGLFLEQFQEAELLVNITEHVLVPLHVVLSKEEKQVASALPLIDRIIFGG
jgi:hypothetical protein